MKRVWLVLGAFIVVLITASVVMAAEAAPPEGGKQLTVAHGMLGLAAALAVAFGAIGTAWAQSRIGAAAAGAIAERPEISGLMIIFMALPETLILFGFVVAFFIIQRI